MLKLTQSPLELEDDLQAGELPRGVLGGAVVVLRGDELELRELDPLVDVQGHLRVPREHQVVGGVGN